MGAERCRPPPAQTPEERDVWRDGARAGWRDGQRESWREERERPVVQSYSFDSYQLEEEELSKDAPERGVLALSEPGETTALSLKCTMSACQLLRFPQTVISDSVCSFVTTEHFLVVRELVYPAQEPLFPSTPLFKMLFCTLSLLRL